ncbi:uncharacterized protein LOC131314043 [Rhododendron vialii]|uniref:uncharacterized protein LOC131314043 n=1 Tax=Rhododendron vialii TaxID=182163 RepID=UPI00265DDEFE|nr:uncharacterized protein LOC131314043 [Rhododendron vialii]XP_058198521.1 uncharacterized protein LOC131314043 [Rhododendron vialii]
MNAMRKDLKMSILSAKCLMIQMLPGTYHCKHMFAQGPCLCIRKGVSMARTMAIKIGKTTLLVVEFPGWSLWQAAPEHFSADHEHCKRVVNKSSQWVGDKLIHCKESHGHESYLWRICSCPEGVECVGQLK